MQINKKFLAGLLCVLFFSSEARSQQYGQLSGTVKSLAGKELEHVTVTLKGDDPVYSQEIKSNFRGVYNIFDIPSGNYIITCSLLGYQTLSDTLVIKSGQASRKEIILSPSSIELNSVSIKGTNQLRVLKESGFSINAINAKLLANISLDLNQVLNRSAGIRVRESGGMGSDFNFSLQGLSGRQVRFFIDGIPMETFGKTMNLNNIPVNLADRIEVYKGVVPVELGGDALGGAVNIVTNSKVRNYLDVGYSTGSFNSHQAYFNGKFSDAKSGLFFGLNGFFNYSDNNYLMRGVQVIENGNYVTRDARRFHDGYRSALGQLEVGLSGKTWADLLSIGITRSNLYKEQQTGATQDAVYGQVTNNADYLMPTLKYRKENLFTTGLSANLFATYARDISNVSDTTSNRYDWSGKVWRTTPGQSERGNNYLSLDKITSRFFLSRLNVAYKLNEHHAINFNYSFNSSTRSQINELSNNNDENPARLDKHIAGMALQSSTFNNRLEANVFGKFYGFRSLQDRTIAFTGGFETSSVDEFTSYFGYGVASRYKVSDNAGLKASYEHSYRLQELQELFGDGITVLSNRLLKPESSDNFNLGLYVRHNDGAHQLSAEFGGFHREAKDFIINRPNGGVSQYVNIAGVRINGLEAELRYNYKTLISASVVGTYQNAINKNQYINGKDGMEDITYKNRIPNQPWLFGNLQFGIGRDNLLGKNTRIQLNWISDYVHWFYLTWSALGDANGKNRIPTQFVHNANISYSIENGRYNIGLQMNNLTDRLAFDNFRLQRPGRNFMLKIRYYITS